MEIKNKAKVLRKGTEIEDKEIGIKIRVTNTRSTRTKVKQDEPEYQIWYDVTDIRSGLVSRCNQKFYHTKQSIHIQGGQRIGKTTTSALMASYLKKEWNEIVEEKKLEIEYNTEALANLNITKMTNEKKTTTKPTKAQEAKQKFDCNDCDFKSIFKWEIKRHVRMAHNISIEYKQTKRPATSPSNPKKVGKVLKFAEIQENTKQTTTNEAEANEKDEYIDFFLTPETSPTKNKKQRANEVIVKEVGVDTVEEEVTSALHHLENTVKIKQERINYLLSENQQLSNKVNNMRLEKEAMIESDKKKNEELGLVQSEYDSLFKATQKMEKEKAKAEEDYQEVSRQLGSTQKRVEELTETLKVTENILKAQEEEQDESQDAEEDDDQNVQLPDEDDEDDKDYLEDEDEPGLLWQVKQKEYACKKCDEKFMGSQAFKNHMQMHTENQKNNLHCYYCSDKFNSETTFLNHISSVHGGRPTCLTCNKVFKTQEEMVNHVVDEHKKKDTAKYKCSSCDKEFTNPENLTEHIIRNHTMLTTNGQSNLAGKQLVKLWPLLDKTCIDNNSQHVKQCYDCGVSLSSHHELMNHKKRNHYKQKLCQFYHTHGDCRFGDGCFNIHEVSEHMNTNHVQRQVDIGQSRWSNIRCRNGPNCEWKTRNRCMYSHSVTNVTNEQRISQASGNTNAFNMKELLESLGARLERVEQNQQIVPNIRSMEDFPNVQASLSKRMTA